jgi:predicted RNA-binding Zn ribbon-like protein
MIKATRSRNLSDRAPTAIADLTIVSGSRCLDLVNTVVSFGRPEARDSLVDSQALWRWAERVGFAKALQTMADDERAFARARRLRDAIGWAADAVARGGTVPAPALRNLGHEAARAMSGRRLVSGPEGLEWQWTGSGLNRVVDELALEAAELLTGPNVAAVRRCLAQDCSWFFLDRSRNHSRRWCAMGDCGNRAKARRRRSRARIG